MLTNKEKSIVPNQDIEWSLKKSRVFAYRKQKTELDKKLQLFEKERRNQMRSISSEMKEMHQFMQDLQVASSFETESRLLFNNYHRESENGKQSGRKTTPTYQESHAREDIRVGSLHRVQESTSSYRKLSWPLRRNKAESPSELELKTTELRGGSSGSHSDRSSLYKYRQENISAGQGIDHVERNSKEKSVQERGNSGSVKIRRLSTPAASNPGSFKGADFSEFTPSRESRDDSPGYKNFVNRPQTGVTTSNENLSRCRIFTESRRISTESRIVDARLSRSRDTRDSQETGVRQKGSESGRSEPIDINQIKNPRNITVKTPSFIETIPLYETSVASQNNPTKDESVAAKEDAFDVAERRAPSQQTIKRELFYKLHGNGSVDNIRVKTTRKKYLRSSYTSSFTETMPVHKTWMATQNSSTMNGNISGKVDTTELENPVAKSTASPRTKKREMNCESRSSVANNSIRTRVKITRVITPSLTETPVTTQNNHVVHQNGAGKTDMAVIGNRTPSPETTNRVLPSGELIDRSQVRGRKTGCSRSFTGPSILVCKESSDTRGVPRNAWTTDASKKTGGGAVLQRRREASARESGSCSPITSSRNFQESWKNRDSPTSRKHSQGSKYKRPLPRNSLPLRYLIRKELKEKRT